MRVTLTSMVLAIFALVTTPVFSWRRPRRGWGTAALLAAALVFSIAILVPQFAFAEQSLDPGQFLARRAKPRQRFGLAGGELKAQAEDLVAQLLLLHFKLGRAEVAKFFAAPSH